MARQRADSDEPSPQQREEAHIAAQALFDVPALQLLPRLENEFREAQAKGGSNKPPGTASVAYARSLVQHPTPLSFFKELAITSGTLRAAFTPSEDR